MARLVHVSDDTPGIKRRRAGKGFAYHWPDGAKVSDDETLARIKGLVIPPAWTDVWICPMADGYLQATGHDARGRKQYRYHDDWRQRNEDAKYAHLVAYGEALPAIRAQLEEDLRRRGLPHDKVVATVVRLLEATLVRVGTERYAVENKSFGLTTMRNRHARFHTACDVEFVFTGKSGKEHRVGCCDAEIVRIVRACHQLPGQLLFQYVDEDGNPAPVGSNDVNAYLQRASGADITAKEVRTWMGTLIATTSLALLEHPDDERQARRVLKGVVEGVAEELGNTPAVARRSYVHPGVVKLWTTGQLAERWEAGPRRMAQRMTVDERRLLEVLRSLPATRGRKSA